MSSPGSSLFAQFDEARARLAPWRSPLVALMRTGGWEIVVWREGPPGAGHGDLAHVEVFGSAKVRLCVADPAVNLMVTDPFRHANRAVTEVLHAARLERDPVDVIVAANRAVCVPELRPRHRNPLAAAVCVDLDLRSPLLLSGARAADCELWVDGDGGWVNVFDGDMLSPVGRARWDEVCTSGAVGVSGWAAQEVVLDDPDLWACHTVGLTPEPVVGEVGGVVTSGVIVGSDGPRLDADAAADLAGWLVEGIVDVGDDWPHRYPFGDVAVVAAQWVGE